MDTEDNIFKIEETKSSRIILSKEEFKRFVKKYNLPVFVNKIKVKKHNGIAMFTIFSGTCVWKGNKE